MIGKFTNNIVFETTIEGLGVLFMEDLAPGSSPIWNAMSVGMLLARAVPDPQRDDVLDNIKKMLCKRKNEVQEVLSRIREPKHPSEYEVFCSVVWAAIVAKVPGAKKTMVELIDSGWKLVENADIDDRSGVIISALMDAACDPDDLQKRDRWACAAFEPLVAIGLNWLKKRRQHGPFSDDQAFGRR